jgi:hypothetical protein
MRGIRSLFLFVLFLFTIPSFAQTKAQMKMAVSDAAWNTREKAFQVFHDYIQPQLQKSYADYKLRYGDELAEGLLYSYEFISPYMAQLYAFTKTSVYKQNPAYFDDFSHVPTPVKIVYEELMFKLWNIINKTEEASHLGEKYSVAMEMIKEANDVKNGVKKVSNPDQARLERLLNDIRNFSPDPDMAFCYTVYGVPSDILNAFNTGCSIFVNRELYNMLDDNELRGVLAHEMSHGALGHGVKTLGQIVKNLAKTVGLYDMDGLLWVLTDEKTQNFKDVTKNGLLDTFAQKTSEEAPRLEIEADMSGAKILNAAGYSANSLISALYKLHGVKPGEEIKDEKDIQAMRNYPSLYKRLQAIRSVMRY